jgi:hypothetical protein
MRKLATYKKGIGITHSTNQENAYEGWAPCSIVARNFPVNISPGKST